MEERTQPGKISNKKSKNFQRVYAVFAALIFIIAVAAVFRMLSSPAEQSRPSAPTAIIRITKAGFQPATVSVKQGTRVVWTNTDDNLHQIMANPYPKGTDLKGLKSEILNNDQAYSYAADTPGTFNYHDQLHPTINGTLVVQKK